ncbi:arsenite efflux transporter metallochaperone ArsD [bacterium]|nr:arsenite efflux transporter metallochaperone ArsD [bacterium]
MAILKVFDPPMCCSTGVCGVDVDPRLTQLVADLNFLKEQGVTVERFNLRDDVKTFTQHPEVIAEMGAENEFLPIFMVDGKIVSKQVYPGRQQLSGWVGVASEPVAPAKSGGSCCSPNSGCC